MGRLELEAIQVVPSETASEFWKEWSRLVLELGTAPFYLAGFVEYYMKKVRSRGWTLSGESRERVAISRPISGPSSLVETLGRRKRVLAVYKSLRGTRH